MSLKKHDSDFYKNLVNVRNAEYDTIMSALSIVRTFIEDRGLIIVGGMAIDFALKLKGSSIYTDEEVPDYDFYSPTHTDHAYELGTILCDAGFKNISCVPAMHITTMRVRVDFVVVADITYCPNCLYKTIPTLDYKKLRVIHPYFQMMDQHRALSIPYENPGMEVMFHRWVKDMKRYDLLYKYYPVTVTAPKAIDDGNVTLSVDDEKSRINLSASDAKHAVKMQVIKIPVALLEGVCLSGWSRIGYSIDKDVLTVTVPIGEPITILSDDYETFIKRCNIKDVKYYSEYIGRLPRRVRGSIKIDRKYYPLEVFDTHGSLISAKKLKGTGVYVCNIQNVMLYMLVTMFEASTPELKTFASVQYIKCRELVKGGEVPYVEAYGRHNFTHSFINSRKRTKGSIYNIKAPSIQPSPMYPRAPACVNNKTFDYTSSEYFKTGYSQLKEFQKMELDPYPEYGVDSVK
jgi:hypothetical protein